MPYKSEKIKLNKKIGLDRRIKLTEVQKMEIRYKYYTAKQRGTFSVLGKGVSQRSLAKEYGVSRRLIVFVLHEDRLIANRKLRKERGGSKRYYNKKENTQAIASWRRWKQKLFLEGKIERR